MVFYVKIWFVGEKIFLTDWLLTFVMILALFLYPQLISYNCINLKMPFLFALSTYTWTNLHVLLYAFVAYQFVIKYIALPFFLLIEAGLSYKHFYGGASYFLNDCNYFLYVQKLFHIYENLVEQAIYWWSWSHVWHDFTIILTILQYI